jgi:hypothetical protein
MRFNERQLDQFGLAEVAVLRDGLKCAVGLRRCGSVLVVIVVLRIYLSFIMQMTKTFKNVMNPVGLGEAQEEQEQRQ